MILLKIFDFYKLAYDYQLECLINSRVESELGESLTTSENKIPTGINCRYKIWKTSGTMNKTCRFKNKNTNWKSLNES